MCSLFLLSLRTRSAISYVFSLFHRRFLMCSLFLLRLRTRSAISYVFSLFSRAILMCSLFLLRLRTPSSSGSRPAAGSGSALARPPPLGRGPRARCPPGPAGAGISYVFSLSRGLLSFLVCEFLISFLFRPGSGERSRTPLVFSLSRRPAAEAARGIEATTKRVEGPESATASSLPNRPDSADGERPPPPSCFFSFGGPPWGGGEARGRGRRPRGPGPSADRPDSLSPSRRPGAAGLPPPRARRTPIEKKYRTSLPSCARPEDSVREGTSPPPSASVGTRSRRGTSPPPSAGGGGGSPLSALRPAPTPPRGASAARPGALPGRPAAGPGRPAPRRPPLAGPGRLPLRGRPRPQARCRSGRAPPPSPSSVGAGPGRYPGRPAAGPAAGPGRIPGPPCAAPPAHSPPGGFPGRPAAGPGGAPGGRAPRRQPLAGPGRIPGRGPGRRRPPARPELRASDSLSPSPSPPVSFPRPGARRPLLAPLRKGFSALRGSGGTAPGPSPRPSRRGGPRGRARFRLVFFSSGSRAPRPGVSSRPSASRRRGRPRPPLRPPRKGFSALRGRCLGGPGASPRPSGPGGPRGRARFRLVSFSARLPPVPVPVSGRPPSSELRRAPPPRGGGAGLPSPVLRPRGGREARRFARPLRANPSDPKA